MVDKKNITLIYEYNENWIGGTYYIQNIIKALNSLDDEAKPILTILSKQGTSLDEIVKISYPYISFCSYNTETKLIVSLINGIYRRLFGYLLIKKSLPAPNMENLYPVSDYFDLREKKSYYFWIPDFQEHHLPHFFSAREIRSRVAYQKYIVAQNKPIIFSSYNARSDYDEFYPGNQNLKKVLNFVSIIDKAYLKIDISELRAKYDLTRRYFIICNQFWKHKNHKVVLEAIIALNDSSFDFVFTGKEFDDRNPEYVDSLKTFILDSAIQDRIRFLGFIDRNEQLKLMQESIAIIQPSLFEGWSTVVEDAKAIGKLIVISDIPLHREQIQRNCIFFNPSSALDLTCALKESLIYSEVVTEDYEQKIRRFAEQFASLF